MGATSWNETASPSFCSKVQGSIPIAYENKKTIRKSSQQEQSVNVILLSPNQILPSASFYAPLSSRKPDHELDEQPDVENDG